MSTSPAQAERWQASTAALEAYVTPERRTFAVELVVPDLRGIIPDNADDEPCIYAHAWDTHDERAIARFAAVDDPSGWVEVCIRKALDETGNRIWHVGHQAHLMRLPHDVLRRIAVACMTGDPEATVETVIRG